MRIRSRRVFANILLWGSIAAAAQVLVLSKNGATTPGPKAVTADITRGTRLAAAIGLVPAIDLASGTVLVPSSRGLVSLRLPPKLSAISRSHDMSLDLQPATASISKAAPTLVSPMPRGVALLDPGDGGAPVLAVSDYLGDRVWIYESATAGAAPIQPLFSVRVPAGPRGLLGADFDADGRTDLAVASAVAQTVTVFLDRGRGRFEAVSTLGLEGIPVALSLGGSTLEAGDSALEVHLADGRVFAFRSLGGGFFDHTPKILDRSAAYSPELAVATAPLLATPTLDFDLLSSCASALAMPAAKKTAAVKKVVAANKAFTIAAAGTSAKKFATVARSLIAYMKVITGQIGKTIDQSAADACTVPAQQDVDAVLLIGTPASLEIVQGDDQTARPFAGLPLSLIVRVHDTYGNVFAKIPVAFSVLPGSDALSKSSVKTDASGNAATTLLFGGPPDGDVAVTANVSGPVPVPAAIFSEHKATGVISFAADVQPIFTTSCALSSCHSAAAATEDLVLAPGGPFDPAKGIVNVVSLEAPSLKRVKPGDLQASYLDHKLRGTQTSVGGSGVKMPKVGSLSASRIFLIEAWITQGAQNN